MQADQLAAAPPSQDALVEAARQIAAAYPDLYTHQQAGVAFLLARRRAILADDMGLGKTRQAIVALREAANDGPFLVICPASLKVNWRREIRLVEPDADIVLVDGNTNVDHVGRWSVMNYDLLGRLEKGLLARRWGGIVVDEAHYVKNESQRSVRVLRILGVGKRGAELAEPEAVYLLTGTPMASRPRDLFKLLQAVRHPLGTSFYTYAKRYCAAFDNGYGLDTNGASNLEELAETIGGVLLRRTKDDALDLPPKVRTWQPVTLSTKSVGSLEARALDYLQRNPARSGPTWATFLGQLNRARHAVAVAKIAATIEAVRERIDANEKAVVFTSYTTVVKALTEAFGPAAVSITGEDSSAARQVAADALQTDSNVGVLIGNLHAAGIGLNLTAATHVLFSDLDWVPGNHWQAEDRIYRIGQTRPAFVTYLLAEGTLDDSVAALLEAKARSVSVMETDAAHHASLLQEVVQAAARGERPSMALREPAAPTTSRSVGLLEETLDLLARSRRGLSAIGPSEQTFEAPSKRRPGEVNTVTVSNGIARCTCTGFSYRGTCSHAAGVVRRLAR